MADLASTEVTINRVEALDLFWAIGERLMQLACVRRDLDGLELTQTNNEIVRLGELHDRLNPDKLFA